jgi:hypothetical protein
MKKLVVILLAIFTTAIIMSSCRSAESCPAYGEAKKFQVEQKY